MEGSLGMKHFFRFFAAAACTVLLPRAVRLHARRYILPGILLRDGRRFL